MEPPTKMGPCGGHGGSNRDMDTRGVNRIVQVLIRHAHVIDAFSFLYERNGAEEWSKNWGGDGGRLDAICLGKDEHFVTVKGHVGNYFFATVVKSLTLVSNLRTYGPYGVEEGMAFTLSAEGGEIVGFHGRSEGLLDALGVYVKKW